MNHFHKSEFHEKISNIFLLLDIKAVLDEDRPSFVRGYQDHRTLYAHTSKDRIVINCGGGNVTTYALDRSAVAIANDFRKRAMSDWIVFQDQRYKDELAKQADECALNSAIEEIKSLCTVDVFVANKTTRSADLLVHCPTRNVAVSVRRHYTTNDIVCDIKIDSMTQSQAETILHAIQNGGF